MTANISAAGVDLDTLFAAHVTSNAANAIGYAVAGVDIQTRFDPLSGPALQNAGARIPAINVKTSATGWSANTDLASIFCGNAGQYSLTTPSGGTKSTTGWTSPKTWVHTITVTFNSAADLTDYFFYGGRIQIAPSQGSGTTADNTLLTMFSNMGTLIIYDQGHYRTGAGGTITNSGTGGANIGTTSVPLFNTTDGSPYTATTYNVSMVANAAAGSATILTITTLLTIVTAGSIADTYTGTYTSGVQQRNYPAESAPVFVSELTSGYDLAWATSTGFPAGVFGSEVSTASDGLGKFVYVGSTSSSTATTTGAISTDNGITWSSMTMPSGQWKRLSYGNGLWVALSGNASASSTYATSTDGVTWTSRTMPASAFWYTLGFGNGYFIAATYGGSTAYRSSDGINWTPYSIGVARNWRDISYGGGTWVLVADNNSACRISTNDGASWSAGGTSTSPHFVSYIDGYFILSNLTSTAFYRSTDGTSWTGYTYPNTATFRGKVCKGTNVYCVRDSGSTTPLVSSNGTNWNLSANNFGTAGGGVVASNSRFVYIVPSDTTPVTKYATG